VSRFESEADEDCNRRRRWNAQSLSDPRCGRTEIHVRRSQTAATKAIIYVSGACARLSWQRVIGLLSFVFARHDVPDVTTLGVKQRNAALA
jgi:hypothetical protein